MAKTLKSGDKVSWDSSGGHSTGKVVKKLTSPMAIKGHKVAASKDKKRAPGTMACLVLKVAKCHFTCAFPSAALTTFLHVNLSL